MASQNDKKSGHKGREERMETKGARLQPERQPKSFSPDLEKLCDDYLKQSVLFAKNFVKLAGLPEQKAPDVEHMIVGECSQVIAKARVSALDIR